MLKALINKLLLILNGHRKNIFAALGLHTTKISIIYYASVTEMLLLLFLHCGVSNHPCSGKKLFLKLFLPSFLYLSCALSFSLSILFLFSETLRLFTLCCSHSAYLLFHISTFALLLCTWLMTVWYLSGVPSVPWYALLCHCCCLVSLFLLLLLLLHPGSQPTLTYVSASDVLIYNRTMLITMLNSSPTLLVTPRDPPECPHPLPQPTSLSIPPYSPPHGRTSWDRSTAHWERLWALLPVAWRNL